MGIILLIARLLLAIVFIVSGLAKLVDRAGSRQAMIDFGVPAKLAAPFGLLLPLAELALVIALIPRASAWWGALGALVLLLLFIAGISYNLAHGRTPDCHCFGQLHSAPIGWPTLVRNVLLAAIAGLLVWFGRIDAGLSAIGWFGALTVAQRIEVSAGTFIIVLLVLETWIVVRVLQQHGEVLLRLHELEVRFAESGIAVDASPASQSMDNGLPVGTLAPTFSLPGLYGEIITLDFLRSSGKPVLLIFSDPGCGPCNALLPEIGRWQRNYAGKLVLALISRGIAEANRTKVSEHELTHVLLQGDREVAEQYQAQGTPCAVLIHADGAIGSPLACGSEQIQALVAQAVGLPALKFLPRTATNDNSHILPMAPVPAPRNGAAAVPVQTARAVQIGDLAPDFALPDLDGVTVSLADFRGQRTLVLFWNPDCGFCQQMLADLKAWEAAPPQGAPQLLVVSTDDVEVNRGLGLHAQVLLDGGFTVGPKFGIHGTPMAVVVDAEGRVASEVAAGATNVLGLASAAES